MSTPEEMFRQKYLDFKVKVVTWLSEEEAVDVLSALTTDPEDALEKLQALLPLRKAAQANAEEGYEQIPCLMSLRPLTHATTDYLSVLHLIEAWCKIIQLVGFGGVKNMILDMRGPVL